MNFFDSIKAYWRNYANFHGRTSKTTFWWTILFLFLASCLVAIIFPGRIETHEWMGQQFPTRTDSIGQSVWSIVTFLPSIALTIRRLQDMGRPGTHFWFVLIPIAGPIMLLIWCLKPGQPHANKDGEPVK